MIRYNSALAILEEVGGKRKVSNEVILLDEAVGRILAADVLSPEAVPSFTNSAMDGFAVFASNTYGATSDQPIQIPVCGLIAAGDIGSFNRACLETSGTSIEIMTGAPVPTGGHDSIVRIEDVEIQRDANGVTQSISVRRPSQVGDHIRMIGTDYAIGQLVLRGGSRVSPGHILASASLGLTRLSVKRRPRVAIVSTGSELVSPEASFLPPGMIRNSTGPFLLAALKEIGVDAYFLGVIGDSPIVYRNTLQQAINDGAEIIMSTGAVSMGKFDFVPEVLTAMGGQTHFHKAAIRPGKPVLFAELQYNQRSCAFFGVPGNPVSTVVGLRFFIEPYLRAMLDLPRERVTRARLCGDRQKPEGLRCFFKGRVSLGEKGLEVESLRAQASYVVSALLDSNCWVVLPEEGAMVSDNSIVDVYPLHHSFERGLME